MYISIDVGGTNIRVAATESLDDPKADHVERFKNQNDYELDMHNMERAIKSFGDAKIDGLSIGIPCLFADDESIARCTNIPAWTGKAIRKDLQDKFNCPVYVDNDTTMAALGEANYTNLKGKDFTFVIWGTGIGATFVKNLDGKVYAFTAEPHHMILDWNDYNVELQKYRRMGDWVGGAGIKKTYGMLPQDLSQIEWTEVKEKFAHGLQLILSIQYAPTVVFGGSIARNQFDKIVDIKKALENKFKIYPLPEFKLSELEDFAGLYGGFATIRNHLASS